VVVAVGCYEALSQNLPGGTHEKCGKAWSGNQFRG
jgi:hypothetical protein